MVGQNGSTCRGRGTGRFCAAIAVVSNTRATARAGSLLMTPDDTRWGQSSEAGQVVDQQLAPGRELPALHRSSGSTRRAPARAAPRFVKAFDLFTRQRREAFRTHVFQVFVGAYREDPFSHSVFWRSQVRRTARRSVSSSGVRTNRSSVWNS